MSNNKTRVQKLETLVATRGGGHPTVALLELRHSPKFFDQTAPAYEWEVFDPGDPGTPQRAAFDLTVVYDEERIWQVAERAGLREKLMELLGRGPLKPEAPGASGRGIPQEI